MAKRAWRQIRPILRALTRHRTAALLIVLQVALTLAVVSNAMFVVGTRLVHLSRPTGTDEKNLFVVVNQWAPDLDADAIGARMRGDVATLRRVPGVADAFASEAYPLEGGYGVLAEVKREAGQTTKPRLGIMYFGDEHAIDTLGVHLVEGRNFRPEEVIDLPPGSDAAASVVIITRSLAHKLFDGEAALGRTVWLSDGPAHIVGILETLQGPYAGSTTRSIDEDTILYPARSMSPTMGTVYLVRSQPGALTSVRKAAVDALWAESRKRIIDPESGIVTLAQARESGYATDRSVALMMSLVSVLLLLATGGGIVGLSSFWVSQRRRHIGVRRALGATASDVSTYFQLENFLLVGAGVVSGSVLAYAANISLLHLYELAIMPWYILPLAAAALWILGQAAVLSPARRASRIAPVAAIRDI
jgi:putative ABC transport system permease protein